MGTFTCSGIAAEMSKFDKLAKGTEAACQKAVQAGGKLLADKLAAAAPVLKTPRKGVTPGALQKSVKAGKVAYNAGDGYHCEVGPKGTDHGENLAKIGNILEYGRSNMPAQPWFDPTVAGAAGEVKAAMQEAFDQAQKAQ